MMTDGQKKNRMKFVVTVMNAVSVKKLLLM